MRASRDTFLHFLADNLTDLSIWNVRVDPTNANASKLQENSINVKFMRDCMGVDVAQLFVSIDAIYSDELTAIDAVQRVRTLLQAAGYTPKLDYTDPANPVPLGTMLCWDVTSINFMQVHSDLYFHHSCLLMVTHHLQ